MLESGNEKAAVSLRYWGLADAERLLELYRAHDDLGRQLPALSSLADAQAAIEHFLPGNDGRAIFCLEVNGQAAGLIGLSFEDKDPATGKYDRAWVWYWSAGELRGKGQMKSAVRLVRPRGTPGRAPFHVYYAKRYFVRKRPARQEIRGRIKMPPGFSVRFPVFCGLVGGGNILGWRGNPCRFAVS